LHAKGKVADAVFEDVQESRGGGHTGLKTGHFRTKLNDYFSDSDGCVLLSSFLLAYEGLQAFIFQFVTPLKVEEPAHHIGA